MESCKTNIVAGVKLLRVVLRGRIRGSEVDVDIGVWRRSWR
jgi:hypothetical protein